MYEARTPFPFAWEMEGLIDSLALPEHKYERIYVGFYALLDGVDFRAYLLP